MSITKDVAVRLHLTGADEVKAELTGVTQQADRLGTKTATLKIDAHDEDFMVQAEEVLAKAKELGATKVRIDVQADDAHARMALDEIRLKADELGLKKVNIKVHVDSAEAEGKLSLLGRLASMAGSGGIGGGAGMGPALGIGAGIGLAGAPALLAGGGAFATLAAPLAGALLGYQKVTAAQTLSLAANKKLQAAELSLSTATGKSRTALAAKVAMDQKAANKANAHTAALKNEFSGITTFMKGLHQAENIFEKWGAQLSKPIFAALTQGLKLVGPLLKDITPVVKAMTPEVGKLVGMLGQSIKSGAIKDFFNWLAKNGPSAFNATLKLVGAIGKLVFTLLGAIGIKNSIAVIQGLTTIITGLTPVVAILARIFGTLMGFIFRNRLALIALGIALIPIGGTVLTVIGVMIALGAAVSWVTQHWKTIKTVIADVFNWIKGHWPLILGILMGPIGIAAAFIIQHFGQIVQGAARMVSGVVSWFRALPGRILGLVSGFGHLLFSAGAALISGLIGGIGSMLGSLWNTVSNFAGSILSKVTSILHIGSPSRKMFQIGYWTGLGLIHGLESTMSGIKSASEKLATSVLNAFKAKDISKRTESKLLRFLRSDNKKLNALATERSKILATIAAAKAYAANVTTSGASYASLSNAASDMTQFGGGVSAPGLLTNLQARLARIRSFSADIRKLAKLGLNKGLLNQIIQAGPDDGDTWAKAILADTSEIKSLNSTQGAINSASKALGLTSADVMYDSGKGAAKGFLTGLQGQEHAIQKLMDRVARNMVNTIRRAEHGHGFHPGAPIKIEWVGGGGADAQFISWLKRQIRIRGGNPAILGR